MAAGYMVGIHNNSAGNITIARATGGDTINGSAKNLTLGAQQRASFRVNAAANGYTLENANPLLTDSTDASKQAVFDLSGLTTGTRRTITMVDANADLQYARAASDTIAGGIEIATQAEVNAMTDTSRAITANHNKLVIGTMSTTTGGTSIDFTGIPSGVRRISINFAEYSTSGTSNLLIQIGDSGGIETSGYVSRVTNIGGTQAQSTAGFIATSGHAAAGTSSGTVVLELIDAATFKWVARGIIGASDPTLSYSAGSKATSAELDRVRITTVGGSDTFDVNGGINVLYER